MPAEIPNRLTGGANTARYVHSVLLLYLDYVLNGEVVKKADVPKTEKGQLNADCNAYRLSGKPEDIEISRCRTTITTELCRKVRTWRSIAQ